ncbi:hypothetical protein EPC69_07945 [Helicobacter pylori]|nr:hypothetical protein EPC81_01905 [Helicobacter pylori]KAA6513957.1 hypothetical protein EPC69_07945 [Helicobacter pylori]
MFNVFSLLFHLVFCLLDFDLLIFSLLDFDLIVFRVCVLFFLNLVLSYLLFLVCFGCCFLTYCVLILMFNFLFFTL